MIFTCCAQCGILSAGVNIPLIRTKVIIKKKLRNMACCWVCETVDTNSPNPRIAIRYTAANANNNNRLPSIGI